jgi:adenylate cyclase
MLPDAQPTPPDDDHWREFLSRPDDLMRFGRHVFTLLPSDPRCRLCTAPFAGPGGRVMRLIGKRPSDGNPNVCTSCQNNLIKHHGGAEVDGTMLFADIRGSTALAEAMSPTAFHDLMERYYGVASRTVIEHDGAIDKFVGDELVAMFYPGLSGENHVGRAVDAARSLLQATGHGTAAGPWVPVGAGVHTGRVWFGAVGEDPHVELTALGDPVNVAARLASAAGPGEVLVSVDAARAAGLDADLPHTFLDLKGKSEPVEVVSVGIGR